MTEDDNRATIEQALGALRSNNPERAASLLRPLKDVVSADRFPWTALANAEIMLGRRDEAAAVLDARLKHAPRDVAALLLRGWLHETAGNARAAVSFYRAAQNQAAANGGASPHLAALLSHSKRYCAESSGSFSARLREATADGVSDIMREAIELLHGDREIDLQQPSVFYYPGLPQRRFYDPADFPWLAGMLALLPAMQAELARMEQEEGGSGFTPYVQAQPNRPAPNNPLLDSAAWTALHFWRNGEVVRENALRCPATMEALALAPMPRMSGRSPNAHWSRLLPGAHIAPHTGMLNTRLICHIPIRTAPQCSLRVGSETRQWIDRIPLVFDDSIEHEARNDGSEERVVLLFEIWRPEIPEHDRVSIARIFEAISDYGL